MDKETNQESPSFLPNSNNTTIKQESPRKPFGSSATGGGGATITGCSGGVVADRLKRDEWSEGAVSSLLEAYESKWILRNRAKLKGHDWEDVARHVSSRANFTKSPKTQTQCKNKIESMKKRYRSESATADASSWPLYPRLDLLLRGSSSSSAAAIVTASSSPQVPQLHQQASLQASISPPLMLLEPSLAVSQPPPPSIPPPPPPPQVIVTGQNSHGSNGVDRGEKVSEQTLFLMIPYL